MDYLDLYDITPEEEAAQDIRDAEQAVDDWLANWSDDFWSDGWLEAALAKAEA
jgi:hypothetical protein